MADDTDQRTVVAYIDTALSGSPLAGLRIKSAGSATACNADWAKDFEAAGAVAGDPVSALVRNPARPYVTGIAQIGVTA